MDENLPITNTSINAVSYEWDFCVGDLDNTPAVLSSDLLTGVNTAVGLHTVETEGSFYHFAGNQGNDLVQVVTSGSDPDGPIQSFTTLSDPTLDGPEWIEIVEEGSDLVGFILNFKGANDIIRVRFNGGITDPMPTYESLGDLGGLIGIGRGLELATDQGVNYIFVTDFSNNRFYRVPLTGDWLSAIDAPGITTLGAGQGLSGPFGISLVDSCGTWSGLISSFSNSRYFQLSFPAGLSSNPTITDLGVSPTSPVDIQIIEDGGHYHALGTGSSGNLYRLSFGDSPSTMDTFTDLGDFGGALTSTFGYTMLRSGSEWRGNALNLSGNLTRLEFFDGCDSGGITSADVEPVGITYNTAGTKIIGLTAIAASGEQRSVRQQLNVLSSVAPSIDFSTVNQCILNTNTFTPSPTGLVSYSWDFDDDGIEDSNLESPTHQFLSTGTHTIRLDVNDGTCTNFVEKQIEIFNPPPTPDFDFSPTTICTNTTISFTNLTNETGFETAPLTYEWDFDGEATSTVKDASYAFTTAGMKTITLRSLIPGCEAQYQEVINVLAGPTAAFSAPSVCQDIAVQFVNNSINAVDYLWDFGDGFMSNSENPSHLYASPGNFDVLLTATDANGCEHTVMQEVAISAVPVVDFNFDVPCTSEGGIQFTDLTTVSGGSIVSRSWRIDGVEVSTEQNPIIVFENEGTVNIELVATSSSGCQNSSDQDIQILSAPQASFSSTIGCIGEVSTFSDLTSSPGNPVVTWLWTVDGVMYNTQNISHVFNSPGMFDVTLEVTGQNFCSETVTQTVEILQLPTVSFSVTGDCSNEIITLVDQSVEFEDPIVSREWFLDGVSAGNGSQLFLESLAESTYDLRLEATTQLGCVVSSSQQLLINTSPQSSFTSSTTFGIPGDEVTFTDTSSGASSIEWLLNGTAFSSDSAPQTLLFSESGTHEVSLVANNDLGCSDTTTVEILIAIPDVDLSIGQFDLVENGSTGTIFLEIQNNSNLPIDITEAVIELENQFSVTEQVPTFVDVGGSELVSLDVGIPLTVTELSYLCVSLNSQYTNFPDKSPVDNEKCITIQPNVAVEPPFPNPTSGQTRLKVIVPEAGIAIITLLDASGQRRVSQSQDLVQGLNNLFVDLQTLNTGIYFVRVETQNTTSIHRVVKL